MERTNRSLLDGVELTQKENGQSRRLRSQIEARWDAEGRRPNGYDIHEWNEHGRRRVGWAARYHRKRWWECGGRSGAPPGTVYHVDVLHFDGCTIVEARQWLRRHGYLG